MQIFLSYPSEERAVAERIHLALAASGHQVFFDREDLPPGDEYDSAVRRAMQASVLLVFLITPQALAPGRYTLTELKLAEERWPTPGGNVLPVLLQATPIDSIPAWLRAVTLLEPKGDVAADVAFEAERLLAARSLVRRTRRFLASPMGIASLVAVAGLGAATWRFGPDVAERVATARTGLRGAGLDTSVRHRARFVAATAEGYAVITSSPAQVIRFDPQNRPLGEPIPLPGEPSVLRQTPRQLLVATRAPDGIAVVDMEQWSVTSTIPLDPDSVAETGGRVSSGIGSIDIADGELWIVTGGAGGDAALLRLRRTGEWVDGAAAMTAPPDPLVFDAAGLRLETINNELWAVDDTRSPTSLYRITDHIRIDEVSGRDVPMIACAHDLATSADGNMLLLSCSEELLEILAAGRDLTRLNASPTLPSESGPGSRRWDIIAPDGHTVFVALNTATTSPDAAASREPRPAHARIARVDESGSVMVFEQKNAVIESMAITPRAVLVVLRLADGSRDARRIPRQS